MFLLNRIAIASFYRLDLNRCVPRTIAPQAVTFGNECGPYELCKVVSVRRNLFRWVLMNIFI